MFLPRKTAQPVISTPSESEALAQKFNALMLAQMEKAKKPSLLGDILISRPGLKLEIDIYGKSEFSDINAHDSHDEDEEAFEDTALNHFAPRTFYNPMLYIAGEHMIGGRSYYRLIALNAPQSGDIKLKDHFASAQKHYRKMPVFSGGNCGIKKTPSLLIPSKSVWCSISGKQLSNGLPFNEISDAASVTALLAHSTKTPALAFSGYLYLEKNRVAELMAYDQLYAVHGLDAETALSPYAESKYLKGFKHMGLEADDVCNLSRRHKQNMPSTCTKH